MPPFLRGTQTTSLPPQCPETHNLATLDVIANRGSLRSKRESEGRDELRKFADCVKRMCHRERGKTFASLARARVSMLIINRAHLGTFPTTPYLPLWRDTPTSCSTTAARSAFWRAPV